MTSRRMISLSFSINSCPVGISSLLAVVPSPSEGLGPIQVGVLEVRLIMTGLDNPGELTF